MAASGVVIPAKLTGSWYPSGFHGHYRAKSRNDIYAEYRQLAKPQPPRAFLTRLKDNPTRHVFSQHDNRFSFITDATYLDLGVGKKRKAPNAAALSGQKDLISWVPAPVPPTVSTTYNNDCSTTEASQLVPLAPPPVSQYRRSYNPQNMYPPQIITTRPKSSFDENADPSATSYRLAFGKYDPNKETISALSYETLVARPPSIRTQPRSVQGTAADLISGRSSVADCMQWHSHIPSPPKQPQPTGGFRRARICEATSMLPPPNQQAQQVVMAVEAENKAVSAAIAQQE